MCFLAQYLSPPRFSECQNSLDPDQAQSVVSPDLDPNCLQTAMVNKLSGDDTSKLRVKLDASLFSGVPKSREHLQSRGRRGEGRDR